MYKELTIEGLNKGFNRENIKEEIKMSIINMGLNIGRFDINFSINKKEKPNEESKMRRDIEQEILVKRIEDERQDYLAKVHINNGYF